MSGGHKPGEFIDGHPNRGPFDAKRLASMGAGVILVAFSTVPWIAKTLRCSEAEARQFKLNAQMDFESVMAAARRAKGGQG
jgi:hypothetical protein